MQNPQTDSIHPIETIAALTLAAIMFSMLFL